MADPGTKTTELPRVFLLKPRGKPEPSHSIDASLTSVCHLAVLHTVAGVSVKGQNSHHHLNTNTEDLLLSGIEQGSTGGQPQATNALPLGSLSWAAVLRPQVQGLSWGLVQQIPIQIPLF